MVFLGLDGCGVGVPVALWVPSLRILIRRLEFPGLYLYYDASLGGLAVRSTVPPPRVLPVPRRSSGSPGPGPPGALSQVCGGGATLRRIHIILYYIIFTFDYNGTSRLGPQIVGDQRWERANSVRDAARLADTYGVVLPDA